MVSLSILGMPGWVNPFCLAMRRPWTLSVLRRRSAGAFFVGTPALVRHPFWPKPNTDTGGELTNSQFS